MSKPVNPANTWTREGFEHRLRSLSPKDRENTHLFVTSTPLGKSKVNSLKRLFTVTDSDNLHLDNSTSSDSDDELETSYDNLINDHEALVLTHDEIITQSQSDIQQADIQEAVIQE